MSAQDNLNSYQFGHRPTAVAGWHEAHEAYPDVYDHPEYYSSRQDTWRNEVHQSMLAARGHPEHPVTIHRALPADAPDEFHEGDWVTPSRKYAEMHAAGRGEETGKPFKIISRNVQAQHVGLPGDYLPEAGYFPRGVHNEDSWKEYRS